MLGGSESFGNQGVMEDIEWFAHQAVHLYRSTVFYL
jgi:hypothetical protein